jgi:hypothetical protein
VSDVCLREYSRDIEIIKTGIRDSQWSEMMAMEKEKERSAKGPKASRSSAKRKRFGIWWLLLGLVVVVAAVLFFAKGPLTGNGPAGTEETPHAKGNFDRLIGDWVRPDGGYIIRIESIDPDGKVSAGYFNPRPINVSNAIISDDFGQIKLFMRLQDQGYPGSTYDLIYNQENDALVGVYYQAAMGQSFEVVFLRKE